MCGYLKENEKNILRFWKRSGGRDCEVAEKKEYLLTS